MPSFSPSPWRLAPESCNSRWFSAENPEGTPGGAHADNDGRKRRASVELAAGGHLDLVNYQEGPGIIRRIWLTFFALRFPDCPHFLRGMRLEVAYEGCSQPAVDVPVGDFFCQGLGRMSALENAFFSSPEGRSLVSCLPLPFRKGVRITLVNDSPFPCRKVYYEVDATVGDELPADAGYLHAHWCRERPTRMMRDYAILPAQQGRGRFLGACFSVLPDKDRYGLSWWGEGECKMYLDGDEARPTLCGTGTEDYIGTGWGQRHFAQQFQGSPICDKSEFEFAYAFYRLHGPDPVIFHREIRATIQQIGSWSRPEDYEAIRARKTPIVMKGGQPYEAEEKPDFYHFEREDDWSSICWFYLDRPENGLPSPPGYEDRVAGLVPTSLRRWNLLGPFPGGVAGQVSLEEALPPGIDWADMLAGGIGGVFWSEAEARPDGLVDLRAALGAHEWCFALARTEFDSPEDCATILACSSDDGLRIWLNGEQVYSAEGSRACAFHLPERIPVRLRRGRNRILARITNHTAGWAFGLGLKSPIPPRPGL